MTHAEPTQPAISWRERFLGASVLKLVLMRLLAVGFLALGLYEWSQLLGALPTGAADFFKLTLQAQAVVLFFAVANLVVAVGLWLDATWGVVVWFAAAAVRIVRHTLFAASLGWKPVITGSEIILIILYLTLVTLEERAKRREIRRQRENRRNRSQD